MSEETPAGETNGKIPPEPDTKRPTQEQIDEHVRKAAAAQAFLHFATTKHADKVSVMAFHVNLGDTHRKNDKRGAQVALFVPDEMVVNIKGDDDKRDVYFLMRIPRYVLDRFNSGIVLPGER